MSAPEPYEHRECCGLLVFLSYSLLFTTSTKHYGSRWCGWSDFSLLFDDSSILVVGYISTYILPNKRIFTSKTKQNKISFCFLIVSAHSSGIKKQESLDFGDSREPLKLQTCKCFKQEEGIVPSSRFPTRLLNHFFSDKPDLCDADSELETSDGEVAQRMVWNITQGSCTKNGFLHLADCYPSWL